MQDKDQQKPRDPSAVGAHARQREKTEKEKETEKLISRLTTAVMPLP